MYIPAQFAQTDPQALHRILREHPLGTLVRAEEGVLDADHIPFELDPAAGPMGVLKAHVARANPLWQRCPTEVPGAKPQTPRRHRAAGFWRRIGAVKPASAMRS